VKWSLLLPLVTACATSDEPVWAFDPIYIEPAGDGFFGFETWQVYSKRWVEHPEARYYLCSVVEQLEGTPGVCSDCAISWDVVPSLVETDCPRGTEDDPIFTSLRGLGFGDPAPAADAPHPGSTTEVQADYGFGWEDYGQAWPEVLDSGGTTTTPDWDGEQAFDLWPNGAWALGRPAAPSTAPTATSESRSAP
jgi:hypothetical protein